MKYSTAVKEDAQRLLSDLRALGLEAQKLIENSASEMTDNTFGRLREQLSSVQDRFAELYGTARQKTLAGAKHTDEMVRSNPYQAVAAAAGIGLLAGFLIGRSLSHD
jgi:ElaB/YqjD/DUF883 family membrane-anchored ribosome-binding protein